MNPLLKLGASNGVIAIDKMESNWHSGEIRIKITEVTKQANFAQLHDRRKNAWPIKVDFRSMIYNRLVCPSVRGQLAKMGMSLEPLGIFW